MSGTTDEAVLAEASTVKGLGYLRRTAGLTAHEEDLKEAVLAAFRFWESCSPASVRFDVYRNQDASGELGSVVCPVARLRSGRTKRTVTCSYEDRHRAVAEIVASFFPRENGFNGSEDDGIARAFERLDQGASDALHARIRRLMDAAGADPDVRRKVVAERDAILERERGKLRRRVKESLVELAVNGFEESDVLEMWREVLVERIMRR